MENISLAGFTGTYFPAKANSERAPVLFIHGAFADHSGFKKLAPHFADHGFNCYAFSRRGRLGQLPEKASGLTFADYLQEH